MNHFDNEEMLSDKQHGSRKFRSCETHLIHTINNLAKSLSNQQQTDSILLNFSKAFDKICHRKLLIKLEHYGIKGDILKWITNFLRNRTQCVVVRGAFSEHIVVFQVSQDDTTRLTQKDLDNLVAWEEKWSMKFYSDKCQLLRVTTKERSSKETTTFMVKN